MPKINVYLPDELAEAVKDAGVPVSAVCQRALEQAVRRITAIRGAAFGELDADSLAARLPKVSPRAREALRLAAKAARDAGAPDVGTGDLLGGMLAEGTNLGVKVLRILEVDPERVERALAERRTAGSISSSGSSGTADARRRFSAPAAAALALAVTEATAMGHNYVGCEHILLGLVTEEDGAAGQVLRALGVQPKTTRRTVTATIEGFIHIQAAKVDDEAPASSPTAPPAPAPTALVEALRRELEPLVRRIERLERAAGDATA